jgi:hypothetical protein
MIKISIFYFIPTNLNLLSITFFGDFTAICTNRCVFPRFGFGSSRSEHSADCRLNSGVL